MSQDKMIKNPSNLTTKNVLHQVTSTTAFSSTPPPPLTTGATPGKISTKQANRIAVFTSTAATETITVEVYVYSEITSAWHFYQSLAVIRDSHAFVMQPFPCEGMQFVVSAKSGSSAFTLWVGLEIHPRTDGKSMV